MNRRTTPMVTLSAVDNRTSANELTRIQSPVAGRTKELQRLYDERVKIAHDQFRLMAEIYRSGVDSASVDESLAKALSQFFTAEYEAATTPQARLDALKRNVENTQFFHDIAQQKLSQGFTNGSDLAKARYLLITARISLAEEERKLAPKAEQ